VDSERHLYPANQSDLQSQTEICETFSREVDAHMQEIIVAELTPMINQTVMHYFDGLKLKKDISA
jgi:hypothetical protein